MFPLYQFDNLFLSSNKVVYLFWSTRGRGPCSLSYHIASMSYTNDLDI